MPPKGSKLGPPSAPAVDPDSPAAQQQKEFTQGISEFELPKTTLTKLAKGAIPDNVKMQQEVIMALMRSSTLFINYLTATAHDQALARSGKSITASDVMKAITEMDFGPADNLVPLLEVELAAYRALNQSSKSSKSSSTTTKQPASTGRARGRKSNVTEQGADEDEDDDAGLADQSGIMDEDDR
ncbi:histone-fold-containing protein [Papiliotrema laurentii]|uniref:DNA polymerase epsilon subunit D n=1 Tax=Papiliotrema laurentii TaxID=5418 RepID=A0AAD9L6K7_PAPLA|nr:histone-fold-containing protein [Papiliotrema laurentii]